jgi:hypothetical protein
LGWRPPLGFGSWFKVFRARNAGVTGAASEYLMTSTRIGLLVIRAWVEPESSSPLRAEIRLTTDIAQGLERSRTVAQENAVVEAVQAWLSEMLADIPTDEDGPDSLSDT